MEPDVRPRAVSDHVDDPRYQRLMAATRTAARDGYGAVSMRDLAESCRLSMTTIYQFCSSKDQLIAEAHLEGMAEFQRRLMARPPKGATPADRVAAVMRSFAKAFEIDEQLSRTLMRAMYSVDPAVHNARISSANTYLGVIDLAVGDEPIDDRDAAIETLGHVIDSVILGWLTGRHDTAWVRTQLEAAVRVLIRPVTPVAPASAPASKEKSSRRG